MGLGEFGLEHSDLPTILSNVAALLRLNCINIDINYKRIPWIFYLLNVTTFVAYFYVYTFSVVWFVCVRCVHTGDIASASVQFSLAACSGTSITKFIYMKLYSVTVIKLVEEYKKCDSSVLRGTRYASNIIKNLRVVKKRAMVIWVVIFVNTSLYVIQSYVMPGRHLTEDLYVIYGLEPMFESPNYEIAQILMIMGIYFAVSILLNITVFNLVLIGYIEAQLLALSEELRKLWDDSKQFYYKEFMVENIGRIFLEAKTRNVFVKNRLETIIRSHVMCIKLRNELEYEMRFINVINFFILVSAIVAELIGGFENTYMQIPFTFTQLFINCLVGQKVIDASNILEKSLYGCNWEHFNITNQKTVLLMLQCSQKTLTLTAGGISALSLSFLMQVIRITYSAYTTLKSSIE